MRRGPTLLNVIILVVLIAGFSLTVSGIGLAAMAPPVRDEPPVRKATHDQTGKLSFLGADPASAIAVQGAMREGLAAQDRGMAVLSVYGAEFGLKNPGQELTAMRASPQGDGRASVRYQQVYEGVPIVAGELIVNMDAGGQLLSISGETSPDLSLSTTPVLTADEASTIARAGVAKWYGLDEGEIETTDPELWIYDERLLRWSERPQELVWRMEVSPTYLSAIKELVLVNAETGGISLHFNQIDTALNRTIYDNQNNRAFSLPGNGPVRSEGDLLPHAESEVNDAYDYSGDTYDFYMNNHGRDSLDGAGMGLVSTVRYCESGSPCPFPNAFWTGAPRNQMVYGDGYAAADDVVGHELTHGVTDFESNLFYYYQSGAISESFSDMWGEFVDLTNLPADPGADRWLMGEDLPIGAIRDMEDPTVFGDPDKATSSNYRTIAADNGGVHSNSGINNKATYLMVDGGTFNGKTVTGMGITKTAAIYYEVQTALLTSGSDYGDLYNALFQGCLNLVGGAAGITNADCQEVRDATDAVEMNLEPSPGFSPEAEVCPGVQVPSYLFSDDLESGTANWQFSAISGPSAWTSTIGYAHSGTTSLWANGALTSSDSVASMASDVSLPPSSNPYLWFAHAYDLEYPDYDGGFLEYSTDSGGSWSDAGSLIDDGKAYNGTLATGSGNPNGGHVAYIDTSHGYVSTRVDLSSLAGQNVRFRWRQSTDSSFGDLGWLVDDVMIYTCTVGGTPTPTPTFTPTPTPTSTPTPTPTPMSTPTLFQLFFPMIMK